MEYLSKLKDSLKEKTDENIFSLKNNIQTWILDLFLETLITKSTKVLKQLMQIGATSTVFYLPIKLFRMNG